jgi:uncharacterized protein YfaP (DUF2135 family)
MERIFDIVKPGGGPINSGDSVSLRINSNLGKTFFFRVSDVLDESNRALILGDGLAPNQPDTNFIVEFVEVHSGEGICGRVDGTVTRAAGGQPIPGAFVEALNVTGNRTINAITANNGTFTLTDPTITDPNQRTCVPAGNIKVRASANRFKIKEIDPVVVPAGGTVNVPIQMDCTQVTVKVVDKADLATPGVAVWLADASGSILLDLNGQPYLANTGLDGSVTFSCVPHGAANAQTDADPTAVVPFDVPPEGTTVKIVVQSSCGNLVGRVVTDLITATGIPNAKVTIVGTALQTTTDANGNFRFNCVKPAGQKTVIATASGCGSSSRTASVPMSGDSQQVIIPLNCNAVVDRIVAILQWAAQPSDLDFHLSGPDGQGGRFHLFFGNRTAPPVPYVALDTDDVTSFGPETLTISKSAGAFVAGDYHVWVHNFIRSTFAGSNATVSIVRIDPQGVPTELTRQQVEFAAGDQADDLWHVANLDVSAGGNVTVAVVQTLQQGDSSTML